MAETTADVRRDIELTRERMSSTIEALEHKLNVKQMVREHPWPALALAVGAGILLSGSRSDVKATAATLAATRGAGSRLGGVLDDLVATLIATTTAAVHGRVDGLVGQIKTAIGAPPAVARSEGYGVGPIDIPPERGPTPTPPIARAD